MPFCGRAGGASSETHPRAPAAACVPVPRYKNLIAQWDILEFSRNPKHVSPKFPDGYWPEGDAPPDDGAWDRSVTAFREDLQAMQDLVADPKTDLFARIPHGSGQTVLREALLVADHNAYHLGQLVCVRRALGAWPEGQ